MEVELRTHANLFVIVAHNTEYRAGLAAFCHGTEVSYLEDIKN